MKQFNSYVLMALLLILPACGGGGSDSDSSSSGSDVQGHLTGKVADGYLQNARVFLDENRNKRWDSGEPVTTTGPGGSYDLDIGNRDAKASPVVAQVIAGTTIDEDHPGTPFISNLVLETPIGRHRFISPLTTLVKSHMEKNPNVTVQDAEVAIRLQLDLGHELTLFDNFVEAAIPGDASQMATDARKCYNAARVVTDLMEDLSQTLAANLGGGYQDTDKQVVQFILTDRILAHSGTISTATSDGNTLLSDSDVNTVAGTIEALIDDNTLDADTVAFYEEKIDQGGLEWDATAPTLISKLPAADQTAPIDTKVTLVFDEELDPATVTNASVTLQGGGSTIQGTVIYNTNTKTLVFTPNTSLASFTTYTVVLSPTMTDWVGNGVKASNSWSFTTIFNGTPPPPPTFG